MVETYGAKHSICFLFQHGEEIGQGGKECSLKLKELHVSEVYAFHNREGYPLNSVIYHPSLTQCSSEGLTITFQGKCCHASAPETGINPSNAIAQIILYIQELISEQRDYLLLCTIVNINIGTKDFGIGAGKGEISCTLRSDRETEMKALEQKIILYATEISRQENLQFSYSISDFFPETRNHPDCIKKIKEIAYEQKLQCIEMQQPWRASEDFGYYTQLIPGAMFYIGNGVDYHPLHTPNYDFNDKIIPTALNIFFALANS